MMRTDNATRTADMSVGGCVLKEATSPGRQCRLMVAQATTTVPAYGTAGNIIGVDDNEAGSC